MAQNFERNFTYLEQDDKEGFKIKMDGSEETVSVDDLEQLVYLDAFLTDKNAIMQLCYNDEADHIYAFNLDTESGDPLAQKDEVIIYNVFYNPVELKDKKQYQLKIVDCHDDYPGKLIIEIGEQKYDGRGVEDLIRNSNDEKIADAKTITLEKSWDDAKAAYDAAQGQSEETQADTSADATQAPTEADQVQTETLAPAASEPAAAPAEEGGNTVLVVLLIVAAVVALLACGAAAFFAVMWKKSKEDNTKLKHRVRTLSDQSSTMTRHLNEAEAKAKANKNSSKSTIDSLEQENQTLKAENAQHIQNGAAWEKKYNALHADATAKLNAKDEQLKKLKSTAEAWKEHSEKWQTYAMQMKAHSDKMTANLHTLAQRLKNYEQVNAELLAAQAPAAPDAPIETAAPAPAPAPEPEYNAAPVDTLEDKAKRISLDLDEVDKYPDAVFLNVANMMTGEVRLSMASSYRTAPIVLIDQYLYLNPYFFVDLPKRRESFNNLRSVEAIFDISGLGGTNLPYGLDYISPARASDIDGRSYRLESRGSMTVSA